MILLGNFLAALAKILHLILMLYLWVVIIRAVLSWVNVPSLYPVILVLYRLTEPALRPFRRLVPPRRLGGVDISPILVALIIVFVDSFLVGSLALYAQRLLAGARLLD
ncbi:MAG: YggT family protein [Clostridiales bacterium]|nr:YggT family protein [Clostridiales bacterium]